MSIWNWIILESHAIFGFWCFHYLGVLVIVSEGLIDLIDCYWPNWLLVKNYQLFIDHVDFICKWRLKIVQNFTNQDKTNRKQFSNRNICTACVHGVNNKVMCYFVVNKCRRKHSIAIIPQRKRATSNDLIWRQVHQHRLTYCY